MVLDQKYTLIYYFVWLVCYLLKTPFVDNTVYRIIIINIQHCMSPVFILYKIPTSQNEIVCEHRYFKLILERYILVSVTLLLCNIERVWFKTPNLLKTHQDDKNDNKN